MHLNKQLSIAFSVLLLTACGGDKTDYDFDTDPVIETSTAPIFSPAEGGPSTNNLLFAGSTDGTLNIPNASNSKVIAAINALDGFSTSNPIITSFNQALDPASLKVGTTIRVFEVSTVTQNRVVSGIISELGPHDIIPRIIDADKKTVALFPVKPLNESTTYMVCLTNGIKDAHGQPIKSSGTYLLLKSTLPIPDTATPDAAQLAKLRAIKPLVNAMENAASSQLPASSIVLSWAFTTQSTTAVLTGVAANAKAGKIELASINTNTSAFDPPTIDYNGLAFTGAADIHVGTLEVPYYLEDNSRNPLGPITGHWKNAMGQSPTLFNTKPVATKILKIPVMMTVPNANSGKTKPDSGWPVVIYQHGITRYRTDMLIYADSLAKAGFAVIAIDLPLHGVPKFLDPGKTFANPFFTNIEPTFNLDLDRDGNNDPSGAYYINLENLLTARDNTRQGVSNLLVLRRSLSAVDGLDANKVSFIAHSLGGVVGVPYLGVEDKPTPSALITTGGSITTIIRDSEVYKKVVKTKFLATAGRTEADYAKFLQAAQWVLDSSDPVNFAMDAALSHPIFMTEVVGGGIHKPDQTVPNSATDTLARLLGATEASAQMNAITVGNPKRIRFIQGDHSSILDPTDDAPAGTTYINVFEEMHSQLSSYFSSNGTRVEISDLAIVK